MSILEGRLTPNNPESQTNSNTGGGPISFGTLDALRKRIKENREAAAKQSTTEPRREMTMEEAKNQLAVDEKRSMPSISPIEGNHQKNQESWMSSMFGGKFGLVGDIKTSFINQNTEEDFLNNEWERILQEVEKQAKDDGGKTSTEVNKTRKVVVDARRKYIRQLVKDKNVFTKQAIISKPNKNQKVKKAAIASNMIEYYNGENIGVEGRDGNMSMTWNEPAAADNKSINDVMFSLLLIDKHLMHMNIISDYEIKK